ncbi:hypothetical protein VPZ79_003980 [Proteus mirabilis]|nr:hypothetical protein [Proteus mirabilis]
MEENDPAYNTPIAITHYAFDKRMINQECMFTYQNNIYKEFKPHNKGNYKKITIANPYKIKNELITLGYNESKIYPSISGLANSLVHNHANDFYRWSFTIKAYNSLVSGNMSGMLLNGTKSNNQSEVYVVASLKNLTNQTCQANDTSAIRFFDGHYIPNMDNIKSFNQTFLFGLCANGKVIADKYSGAVDVSFIVE